MTRAGKILSGLGIVLLLFIAFSLASIWWSGAWRVFFPSHHHDVTPPELAADYGQGKTARVMVFTRSRRIGLFQREESTADSQCFCGLCLESLGSHWPLRSTEAPVIPRLLCG